MSNRKDRDKIDRSHSYMDDAKGYQRPLEDRIVLPPDQKNKPQMAPMGINQSAFERRLVNQEKEERLKAKNDYIAGIQGLDGGAYPTRDGYPNHFED